MVPQIYSKLGGRCNHELTIEFIRSGYNTTVLAERRCEK